MTAFAVALAFELTVTAPVVIKPIPLINAFPVDLDSARLMFAAMENRLAEIPPAAGVKSVVASEAKLLTTLTLPEVIVPVLVSDASNVPAA